MSLRDVEDLLAARGVVISYETIRAWVAKFGLQYAKAIRRNRPKVADKWHLDEVVLPINGEVLAVAHSRQQRRCAEHLRAVSAQ